MEYTESSNLGNKNRFVFSILFSHFKIPPFKIHFKYNFDIL